MYFSQVCRHLSKLFDSIAKLEFEEGSKKAFKMISKDTEEMFLDETCDCVGEVEDWLGLVEKRMKASVGFSHCKREVYPLQSRPPA